VAEGEPAREQLRLFAGTELSYYSSNPNLIAGETHVLILVERRRIGLLGGLGG